MAVYRESVAWRWGVSSKRSFGVKRLEESLTEAEVIGFLVQFLVQKMFRCHVRSRTNQVANLREGLAEKLLSGFKERSWISIFR